jgi:SPP1 gp7 family putative phage head morphogenesis protein
VAAGKFRNQAYIVSGVRTKSALKNLLAEAEAVVDSGGSFTDFMKAAELKGFSPENPMHWLTEFETAKVAAKAAGQWQEFEADADLFPYLQYLTLQDNLVRDEHIPLHGTIAELGSAFWMENYPPNGWNCRCYAEQLTRAEAEGLPGFGKEAPSYVPPEGFRKNVGIDGKLPGDAEAGYGDYADGPDKDLFTTESGPAVPGMGRIRLTEGNDEYVRDANGYPVLMDGFQEHCQVLTQPNEIWQAKGVTRYIRASGDQVQVLSAEAGKATELQTIWKDEYKDQGREGFQEL